MTAKNSKTSLPNKRIEEFRSKKGRVKDKRNKTRYPGLDKSVNTKKRWEEMDQDYIDQLNPEEKEWLNKFMVESLGGNFKKNKKGSYEGNLHKKKSLKESYL